jgi:hypothetical protein
VSTRVIELWDQRPIRLVVSALAAAVLVLGMITFVRSRQPKAVDYAGSKPLSHEAQLRAEYGRKIPLPAEVRTVARSLVSDGILRRDPLAARKLVSPELAAAATDQQWAQGSLPMPQFPAKDFAGAGYKVMRSRARDVLLQVTIGSTDVNAARPLAVLVELRRFGGHWLVVQAAPPNSIPTPSGNAP